MFKHLLAAAAITVGSFIFGNTAEATNGVQAVRVQRVVVNRPFPLLRAGLRAVFAPRVVERVIVAPNARVQRVVVPRRNVVLQRQFVRRGNVILQRQVVVNRFGQRVVVERVVGHR